MSETTKDREFVIALSRVLGKSPSDLAVNAGIAASTLTRVVKGKSRLSLPTIEKLQAVYPDAMQAFDGLFVFGKNHGIGFLTPDEANKHRAQQNDDVEIPTIASLPGEAIRFFRFSKSELLKRDGGKASDFAFLTMRGNSMQRSGFYDGDRILLDLRATDPSQPGIFAIADGQINALKIIERVPAREGWLRVYTDLRTEGDLIAVGDLNIVGRPAWVARYLE